jgi:tight adherence protein B
VLFQLEPTSMARLFDTTLGLSLCALIAVLQLLGLHFVRRIVAIDV